MRMENSMMARHIGTEAKLFSFAVLSHQNLDRISRTGGLGRDQIALEGPAVERDALHPVLHARGIVHADLVIRPARVGFTPRIAWEIDRKDQAAVPVSQEFLASPKLGASLPATIWL